MPNLDLRKRNPIRLHSSILDAQKRKRKNYRTFKVTQAKETSLLIFYH
jgi:hypothetical protein